MNNSLDYFNQINTNNQLVNEQKTEAYQKKQLSLEHLNRISEPLNLVGSEMALGALRGLGGKVIDRVADKTGSNALRSIAEGVRTGKITDIKGVSENLRKQAETAFKNKTGNLNETFDSLSNKASQGVRNAKAVIRDAPNKIQARVKATKQTIEEKAKQGIASNIDDSLPKMTTSGAQTETPKLGLKGGVREPPVLDEERLIYDPNVSGGIKRRKAGGGFQDYKSPESELKRQLDLQKAKLEDTSITPRAAEQRRLRREGKDPDDIDLPRKGEAPPRITTGQEELPKIDFGQQIKETPEEAQARRETDLQKSSKEIGTRGAKGEDEDIKITPRRQRINPATQTEGLDPSTLPEGAGMRGAGGQKIEAARPSSPTLEPLEPSKKVSFGESEIKTFESDKPPSMEEHLQQIKNKKQLRSDFNSLSGEDKLRYSKGTKNLNISSQSDRQNLMSNIKNNPTIEQPNKQSRLGAEAPSTAPPISTQTEPDPATTPTIATPETPAEPAPAEPAPAEPTPKPTPTEPAPTEKPFEDLGKTAGADAEIGLGDLADPLLGVGLMLIPSLLGSSEDKTTPVPAPISVSNQQGTN